MAARINGVYLLTHAIYLIFSGEADPSIAERMKNDPSVFAVFTNDTDFTVFPGSVMLPDASFDIENDLDLISANFEVAKPKKLICKIVRSDQLWRNLGVIIAIVFFKKYEIHITLGQCIDSH